MDEEPTSRSCTDFSTVHLSRVTSQTARSDAFSRSFAVTVRPGATWTLAKARSLFTGCFTRDLRWCV